MKRNKKAHKKIRSAEVENEKDSNDNEDDEDNGEEEKHNKRENKAMQKQTKKCLYLIFLYCSSHHLRKNRFNDVKTGSY